MFSEAEQSNFSATSVTSSDVNIDSYLRP